MRKTKKVGAVFLLVFTVFIAAAVAITLSSYDIISGVPTWNELLPGVGKTSGAPAVAAGEAQVHFVDCWQGDCAVLLAEDQVTVIDTYPGTYKYSTLQYIRDLGVEKIDNLILTHPHEDHIGGAQLLIESFEIGNVYMARPAAGKEPTTAVYLNLLTAIRDKGLTIAQPPVGGEISAGPFTLQILAPNQTYEEPNNDSIVLRAVYGQTSFLFTGDAEREAESDVLERFAQRVDCDVLKAGHHGSSTSSTDAFVAAASPQYAVISCGAGNSYGHPSGKTLETYAKYKVTVLRTDLSGSIVFTTDGTTLSYQTQEDAA